MTRRPFSNRFHRSNRFRRAAPASTAWNLTKTTAQTAFFWALFLLVLPLFFRGVERRLGIEPFAFPAGLAWAIFAVAGVLGLVSGYTMATAGSGTPLPLDAPRRLVVSGPYRYVRNPMAVTGLAQGAAVGAVLGSWLTMGMILAGFFLWDRVVRPVEEQDLEAYFGEPYRDYRRRVRCWIPSFRGYP